MSKLPLAIDIADAVRDATRGVPINVASTAGDLIAKHPEADSDQAEVMAVLCEEISSSPTRSATEEV